MKGSATMLRGRRAPRMEGSTVTVVVPCYNYGHFLAECIDSILTQTGVALEILVVDDASPDGSQEVARGMAAQHPEVSVIAHATNAGHIATYNEGLAHATGDYVILLSADDLLAPGALLRACAVLDSNPSVGLVYGLAPSFADELPHMPTRRSHWWVWPGRAWLAGLTIRSRNPVITASAVVRREAFAATGGYDPRLPHAADLLLWLQVGAAWDVAYLGGAPQAYYRQHPANMHAVKFGGIVTDLTERKRTFEIFFEKTGSTLPRASRLRRRAMHALHREASAALVRSSGSSQEQGNVDSLVVLRQELATAAGLTSRGADRRSRVALWAEGPLVTRLSWHTWRRFGVYL